MEIKRKKIDLKPEQDLITGLIVSDRFIREMYTILNPGLLKTQYARIIAHWCLDYFRKYEKCPSKIIQDIFNAKIREKEFDEDSTEQIEIFLENLSDRYESFDNFNDQYLLDQSEKYLARRKLETLQENITHLLSKDKINEAEAEVASHTRLERPQGTSIDILNKEIIIEAFNEEQDYLFQMPGVLGEMIGGLSRGDFFSIIAPMKRGKTYWLLEFALRASFSHLKVLFVSLEMTRNQMVRRAHQNLVGLPMTQRKIEIPYFDDMNKIMYEPKEKDAISTKRVLRKAKALDKLLRSGGFRLWCRPSDSINVKDIKTEIENLSHYHDFFPDVVVVDYADLLAPEPGSSTEVRHKLDKTWKALRSLSQELNILNVTATQASKATFNNDITEEHVAEDIRKIAHVTHMMALNQTKDDKRTQFMRLAMIANRNEEFHIDDEVICLYNYSIGKPFLDGRWKRDTSL